MIPVCINQIYGIISNVVIYGRTYFYFDCCHTLDFHFEKILYKVFFVLYSVDQRAVRNNEVTACFILVFFLAFMIKDYFLCKIIHSKNYSSFSLNKCKCFASDFIKGSAQV